MNIEIKTQNKRIILYVIIVAVVGLNWYSGFSYLVGLLTGTGAGSALTYVYLKGKEEKNVKEIGKPEQI